MPAEVTRLSPEWDWLIVLYFFVGGIAAGAYFSGAMLELFGHVDDRPAVRVAHYLTFPLLAISGILLIVDLEHPERFFHMLVQSSRMPLPMFKWWSPMSLGSWALLAFSGVAFLSFLDAVAEDKTGRAFLHRGQVGRVWAVLGSILGFFFASYTGVLLATTNYPVWADSPWVGVLFLASAASTGLATMALLLRLRPRATAGTREKLVEADAYAMGMELVLIVAFVVTLGAMAAPFVSNAAGALLLWGGVVLLGLLVPLGLHLRPRLLGPSALVVASLLTLGGGLILRYVVIMVPQAVFS